MCGIAGFCDYGQQMEEEKRRDIAEKMGDTLRHRGPDDFGSYAGLHTAFAHARLAIIDIEGGRQPMSRSVGGYTYTIVYNGELYNTPELRRELTGLGYELSTRSDTEVLLCCYIHFGERCPEKLNGIFSFAVEDTKRDCLFFCRDRLGVKPLFYTLCGTSLVFGSEIKAILQYPGVSAEADRDGLCQVLALGPARSPGNGVFRNIKELLPGQYGIYDPEGLRLCRYWRLSSHDHPDSYEQTVEKVRELLLDAIARQTVSDVPLCTFLSGGIDSSFITAVVSALYKRLGREPLHTYSFDFTGNDSFFSPTAYQPDADRPWVEAVSRYLDTDHTFLECGNFELADALKAAVWHKDLPGMADVDASLLYFCRGVAKKHIVAISGECADEIFGGYPWFHTPEKYERDQFPWSSDVSQREALLTPEARDWLDLNSYAREQCLLSCESTPGLPGESRADARRREIGKLNIDWFMATLLDRKDRMSMASGLEVRVPFADHRLVEYVFNVPWEYKCPNGEVKGLLRDAAHGLLPEPVVRRKKSPYPKTHNPGYEIIMKKRLAAVMEEEGAPIRRLVDPEAVKQLIARPAGHGSPWFGQLMSGPQMIAWIWQISEWLNRYHISF